MSTIIKQTSLAENHSHSAIDNAVQAGISCIKSSGVDPKKIGILINAGVFRDENIMEPSIASLIQSKIHLGLDFDAEHPEATCFSFDLINGACGFINAVQVADSILKNGATQYALIVAGDCHPSKTPQPGFPFESVGTAMLLSYEDSDKGFQNFSYRSSSDDQQSTFRAFGNINEFGDNGRERVQFEFSDSHQKICSALASQHIKNYLDQHSTPQVDFFIGNDIKPGFCREICDASGLSNTTRVIDLNTIFNGDVHTSSCIAGFAHLNKELPNLQGRNILFSSTGSGNATTCVLYRA